MTQQPAAFYCVADESYFLGAVGTINSLRLVGHREPVFLLDCGLSPTQRELLAPHVTLVPGPADEPPFLVKPRAALQHPAEVMVLIDADLIAVRPLTPLIERAASGSVVAFRDRQDRFFPEWGQLLGLGKTRRQPYLSSSLVFLGGSLGRGILELMNSGRQHVDFDRTFWRGNVREYPFLYADQDVLNAVLAARLPADRIVALENRLAPNPPFRRLRLLDEATLRCAYRDGTEPYVIHQYVRKPWLERVYHGIYSRLLARLLLGPGIAIRVPESGVPLRMRNGGLARAERARVNAIDFLRWHFGDLLPKPVGARVEDLRRRRAAARGRS